MLLLDVLANKVNVGEDVIVIGAGGIGFDVAEYLTPTETMEDPDEFLAKWGVDMTLSSRGGFWIKRRVET